MPKQTKTIETSPHISQARSTAKPAKQRQDGAAPLPNSNTLSSETTAQFGNERLSPLQRQLLMSEAGQVQGNKHLQRTIFNALRIDIGGGVQLSFGQVVAKIFFSK